MRVTDLALEDFRSYADIKLALGRGVTAFIGANGAGKTNLLEAVHLAARGDSPRANDDTELVRWGTTTGRAGVHIERAEGKRRIELLLFAPPEGERRRPRRYLLDGAGKRAEDVAGELVVVAFFPEDVDLLGAAPSARRRYLDAMLSQIERAHRRETRELQRVLEQRNALLRAAREDLTLPEDELAFWDRELVRLSSTISLRRAQLVNELIRPFRDATARFSGATGLDLTYGGQVEGDTVDERAAAYNALLREKRERERWQGTTLVGPHRDDLLVTAGGRALPSFASRGEHRSAVLSLKMAEAAWLTDRIGEPPVFLLDDVLSELDPGRREALAAAIPADAQALLTAATHSALPDVLRERATVVPVRRGEVG
ncbi:MAG TPA: DNA replication and repair protein RecF [Candidatus Limnocylindrales bacterium]|nr:DNA replication and repair protein RecF [Candidatus Limnocylindrales bacterium]